MQPISFTNITTPISLAQYSDVYGLIPGPIDSSGIDQSVIEGFLKTSQRYIENKCNQKFSPRKIRFNQDGQNSQIMIAKISTPIININKIEIWNFNLLGLHGVLFDYQLNVDSKTNTIGFPITNTVMPFLPASIGFFQGFANIRMDLFVGHHSQSYEEEMTSTDLTNYTFANSNVIEYTEVPGPNSVQPPLISPCIYVNGVYQQNRAYAWSNLTTYGVLGAVQEQYNMDTWQIEADDLIYTTNYAVGGGISGITFNTPLTSDDIVTCMYRYAYIPEDINQAVAKHAAILTLRSIATGIYTDIRFQGVDEIQDNTARVMSNTGRWESQITGWESDITETIVANKKTSLGIVGNSAIRQFGGHGHGRWGSW